MLQIEGLLIENISVITIVQVLTLDIACMIGGIIGSLFYQKCYRANFVKND